MQFHLEVLEGQRGCCWLGGVLAVMASGARDGDFRLVIFMRTINFDANIL